MNPLSAAARASGVAVLFSLAGCYYVPGYYPSGYYSAYPATPAIATQREAPVAPNGAPAAAAPGAAPDDDASDAPQNLPADPNAYAQGQPVPPGVDAAAPQAYAAVPPPPPPGYYAAPAYPAYYPAYPAYPAYYGGPGWWGPSVSLRFGYWGGWHGGWHGHH